MCRSSRCFNGGARAHGGRTFQVSNNNGPSAKAGPTVINTREGKIMNRRSVLTMMAVGVIGFCASSIARADEVVKFRMFLHATSVQSQEVGDVDGHVLGVGHFSGLVSFSDGSVGPGNLTFTADFHAGCPRAWRPLSTPGRVKS